MVTFLFESGKISYVAPLSFSTDDRNPCIIIPPGYNRGELLLNLRKLFI